MNKKIYAASLIFLFALNVSAMEEMIAYTQALLAEEKVSETNIIPIHVPKVRNEKGGLDENEIDLLLSLDPFKELIRAKHAKNDSYLLVRTLEQIEDGSVVNYFDAHAFNRAVFGQYAFNTLNELSAYNHPITKKSLHWLEYYECSPDKRVFTLLCTYAALRSSDANKQELYRLRFYANQDDDLKMAAIAQNNIGYMHQHGLGVAVDHAKVLQLYERVANQKDDLGAAASAQNNLGYMHQYGQGVPVDYAKALQLYDQAANQQYDLRVAAIARENLAKLEELMKKND
jgi:hypothetical protein